MGMPIITPSVKPIIDKLQSDLASARSSLQSSINTAQSTANSARSVADKKSDFGIDTKWYSKTIKKNTNYTNTHGKMIFVGYNVGLNLERPTHITAVPKGGGYSVTNGSAGDRGKISILELR